MASGSPVRSPELTELKAFETAARLGSIGAAAREVGVSQPAMSKRLRTLETVVGAQLLERTPHGVRCTPVGATFLQKVNDVLASLAALEDSIVEFSGHTKPVRLACSPVIAESVLPEMLTHFHRIHGEQPVELIVANSDLVRDLVESGRADLGIAIESDTEADVDAPVLCEDELVVALVPSHEWAGLDQVPVPDLVSQRLILRDPGASQRRLLDAILKDAGFRLALPLIEVGSTASALADVIETGAPAVVSRLSVNSKAKVGVVFRRIASPLFVRRFLLVSNPNQRESLGQRKLASSLTQAASELCKS